MCDADEAMSKAQQCADRIDRLESQVQALLSHLKLGVKYTPELYEVVKREDMEIPMPMKVR